MDPTTVLIVLVCLAFSAVVTVLSLRLLALNHYGKGRDLYDPVIERRDGYSGEESE